MNKQSIILLLIAFSVNTDVFSQGVVGKQINHLEESIKLANSISLEYVEQGPATGVPVIFLHGLSDSWHSFETVLANLPASVHAFAISQRGHGDSERPLEGYTPRNFAADIAAFIKKKNLQSAFIVGHSMGGVNALQFALDYPQLASGIIIIDSDPAFKDNAGMPEFLQQSLQLEGTIERPFMEEFQKSTLSQPIDTAYFNLLVDEGLKVPLRVFKDAFRGFMEVDYTNDLKKITAPVLILWGANDGMTFRKDQQQLEKGIKNAKLIVYEDTGHALHWQQPKRFADDLLTFISESSLSK